MLGEKKETKSNENKFPNFINKQYFWEETEKLTNIHNIIKSVTTVIPPIGKKA